MQTWFLHLHYKEPHLQPLCVEFSQGQFGERLCLSFYLLQLRGRDKELQCSIAGGPGNNVLVMEGNGDGREGREEKGGREGKEEGGKGGRRRAGGGRGKESKGDKCTISQAADDDLSSQQSSSSPLTHLFHQHVHHLLHTLIHCPLTSFQNEVRNTRGLIRTVDSSETWGRGGSE